MKRLFLASLFLLSLFLLGCIEDDGATVYRYYRPLNCLENPWQQKWMETHDPETEDFPWEEELTLFKEYYQSEHEVYFYGVDFIPSYDITCAACNCPRDEIIRVLVSSSFDEDLNALGFFHELDRASLVDENTYVSIQIYGFNNAGFKDEWNIYNSGEMERSVVAAAGSDVNLFEGQVSRTELERVAVYLLENDFLSFEEKIDCFDCGDDPIKKRFTLRVGSDEKVFLLIEPEFIPFEVKGLLDLIEPFEGKLKSALKEDEGGVNFAQLVFKPEKHVNRFVCVKGVYEIAEEHNVLKGVDPLEEVDLGLFPESIWLAEPNTLEKTSCTDLDTNSFPWRTCLAIACGKFEYNPSGGFGVKKDLRFQIGYYTEEDWVREQILVFDDCAEDLQCLKVQAGCCNCNNGGKNVTINGVYLTQYNNLVLGQCEEVFCPTVISDDPSCLESTEAKCVNNICTLVEAETEDSNSFIG